MNAELEREPDETVVTRLSVVPQLRDSAGRQIGQSVRHRACAKNATVPLLFIEPALSNPEAYPAALLGVHSPASAAILSCFRHVQRHHLLTHRLPRNKLETWFHQ